MDLTGTPLTPAPATTAVTVDDLIGTPTPAPSSSAEPEPDDPIDAEVVIEDEPDWAESDA